MTESNTAVRNKKRLLRLLRYLYEYTDEENPAKVENELFARFEKAHLYDCRIPVREEDSEGKVLEEVLALIG